MRVRDVNSVPWRRAELPAVGGFGTARSVARVQALLADRRADGAARPSSPSLPSLSRAVRDRARQEQFAGVDRVLGVPMRYGLGYGLFGTACGWGGWGGSLTMVDPAAGMAVAYVTNQMREPGDDQRGLEIVMAAYDGLQGRR